MNYPVNHTDPNGPTFREALELVRTEDVRNLEIPTSSRVDERTAEQLIDAVVGHAARTSTPRLSTAERLARAAAAGDAARDLEDVAATLDPYRGRTHNRIRDLLVAARSHGIPGDVEDAVERLALARQAEIMRRAWADLTGVTPTATPAGAPTTTINPATWLNSVYVTRVSGALGKGRMVANGWSDVPEAHLDPEMGEDVSAGTQAVMDGDEVPWHVAAIAFNVSRQRIDWALDDGIEVEHLMATSVDTRLEGALLADLAAVAPAAASFEAAEAAVGAAWAPGADLIVCAGVDRPAVVRAYALEQLDAADRPTVLSTAGAVPGTALVMASAAVRAEAYALEWLAAVEPRVLGKSVAALRYALAHPRIPGAVQAVTLGA